ncbi:MAG: hypothetical protein A3G76_15595 [Acidobacteria bacterium RIFCSPLOWO2_12_FULL_65_11]|nr:MAG: hypothetical protein A3H95_17430 [Acidobacteria bacterium RIFCSPLOWO2_02_FULL_64_15]OFW30689.1 MAG: hypothetical protein A3G76_15595 [Acidobacteria bacterium RIFCSPLOWO2_12_FULL_65_11]
MTVVVLALNLIGCSQDPPTVRVRNERPTEADVQLKPPSGSTINISDVAPGATTGYLSVGASNYEVVVNITNVSESPTTFFNAGTDRSYTIVVVNSTPATVRVDAP